MIISFLLPEIARVPVGGHKVVYEYCNKLVEKGHEIHIYYFYGNRFKKKNIPEFLRKVVIRIYGSYVGPKKWFDLDKKVKLHVIKTEKQIRQTDVLIATGVETAKSVANYDGQLTSKFYFVQDYETWTCPETEVLDTYRLKLKKIVVSKWLKVLVDKYSEEEAYLISNCIDERIFKVNKEKRLEHSLVFHYRSAQHKGASYALEVINRLLKIYPNMVVNVISPENIIEGLPKNVIWYKGISPREVAAINNRSQVFMCTSIDEGFGLPGLEAMACGAAVVSTEYKGVLEYAVNGENALLSPVRDVQAMVDNIKRLFEDEDLRKRISENGVKTGKDRSLQKAAGEFEQVLLGEK